MAESANNPVNPNPNPSKMPPGNDAGAARANPAAPAPASVPPKLSPEESTKRLNEFAEAVKNQKKIFQEMKETTEALNKAQKKTEEATKKKSAAEDAYAKLLKERGDAGLTPEEVKAHTDAMKSFDDEIGVAKKEQQIHSAQLKKASQSTTENRIALDEMFSVLSTSQLQLNASQHRAWGDAKYAMMQWIENTQKDIVEQTALAAQLEKRTNALKKIEDIENTLIDLRLENESEAFDTVKAVREEEIKSIEEKRKAAENQAKEAGLSEEEITKLKEKLARDSDDRQKKARDKFDEKNFADMKKRALELARFEQKLAKDKSVAEAKEAIQQAKIVRAGDINAAMKEIEARELMRWQLSDEGSKRLAMAKTDQERQEILKKKSEEILRSEETKKSVLAKVQEKHQEEYQKKRLEEIQKIAKEEKISVAEATKKFDKSDESTKMAYESRKELEDISRSMDRLYTINEQGQAPLLEALGSIDESSARSLEESVEGKYTKPMWVMSLEKVMGAGFADTVSGLASGFNSLKPPGGGWFKTLLLVGAFIVGGIIAYLAKWIVIIGGIIGNIGKFLKFPVLFAKLGNMFTPVINAVKGVAGFFGLIFGPQLASAGKGLATAGSFIGKAAATIMKIFPFLGNIVGAFRFGFALVSKIFLPLQIIISLIQGIIGAFKGFKKDGLRGAIAGFFANIISGLTFGLVKFDSVYKLFRAVADIVIFIVNAIWMGIKALWFVVWNVLLYPVRKMVEALFILIKGLVIGFIQGFKVVAALVNGMFILIGNILDEIVNTVYEGSMFVWEEVISPAIDAIVGLFEPVGEFFGWVYDEYVQPVFDGISGFFGGIGEFFVGVDEWLYSKLGWLGYTKISGGGGGAEPSENSGALASGEVTKAIETTKEITQSGTGSVSSVIMAAGRGGGGGGVQPVIVSSANSSPILNQITAGNAVSSGALVTQTSSVVSEKEKLAAAASKPNVVVNAPKTIAAGGGGGEGGMIIPKFSRNNDPTYRALCFMEAPAM